MKLWLLNQTRAAWLWRPVMLRGSIYFAIAFLAEFLDQIKVYIFEPDKSALLTFPIVLWVFGKSTLAGLLVIRAFLDSSIAKHKEELKQSGDTALLQKA